MNQNEPSAASAGSVAGGPLAWAVMIEGSTIFGAWLDEQEAKRERRRLRQLYEGTRHGRIVAVPLFEKGEA